MKKIDLNTPAFDAKFANAPLYVKTAIVSAVQITEEGLQSGTYANLDVRYDEKAKAYVVDTYVMEETEEEGRKAKLENTRTVEPGMWLVTNPVVQEGDRLNNFAMDDKTFKKRYVPEGDHYRAKGRGWIIPNDSGEEVEITPPWGGTQAGGVDCFFVCAVDDENPEERGSNRYILSQNDFAAYGLASEVLGEG